MFTLFEFEIYRDDKIEFFNSTITVIIVTSYRYTVSIFLNHLFRDLGKGKYFNLFEIFMIVKYLD